MNIVVNQSPYTQDDLEIIFDCEEVKFVDDIELSHLLCDLGVYKSRSMARRAKRFGAIPKGYTEYKASKKVTLFIWNPTE